MRPKGASYSNYLHDRLIRDLLRNPKNRYPTHFSTADNFDDPLKNLICEKRYEVVGFCKRSVSYLQSPLDVVN